MKTTIKLPWLAFIAGTRAALGFGAGLLLSGKIPEQRRRTLGLTLIGIGAATTIPAFRAIRAGARRVRSEAPSLTPRDASWIPESEYLQEGQSLR